MVAGGKKQEVRVTISELYNRTKSELLSGGVENAAFEAEQLLRASGIDKLALIAEPGRLISEKISAEINARVSRRISGEPLQYILGEWEFYGLPFYVGSGVLIPRQDTETLVDVALEFLESRGANSRKTLDLCAGSGCIGIALAKLANADVTSVEKSPEAFEFLNKNAALNDASITAVLGDAFDGQNAPGEFDLIVCNPPYLTAEDMRSLQREVRFEPEAALFGGEDGLNFYRRLIPLYSTKLNSGGLLAVEIGMGQENAVCELFRSSGFSPQMKKDANGIIRVIYGKYI